MNKTMMTLGVLCAVGAAACGGGQAPVNEQAAQVVSRVADSSVISKGECDSTESDPDGVMVDETTSAEIHTPIVKAICSGPVSLRATTCLMEELADGTVEYSSYINDPNRLICNDWEMYVDCVDGELIDGAWTPASGSEVAVGAAAPDVVACGWAIESFEAYDVTSGALIEQFDLSALAEMDAELLPVE